MSTAANGANAVVACPNCGTKNRVPSSARGAPRCGKCRNPLPWIINSSDADFARVADASTVPVLVDVWAPWCGPCRMVSPVLEQLATEFAGTLKLVKVNADEAPDVSRRFGIRAIPTLILMHHGEVIDTQIGAAPAPALRSWLTAHLPSADAAHGPSDVAATEEDPR